MDLDTYIKQFAGMRRDRNTKWTAFTAGGAPHKPLLMLSVIDAIEAGEQSCAFVDLDHASSILDGFQQYWRTVMPASRRGDVFKPFFHLRSSSFWELVPRPGSEDRVRATTTVTSLRQLTDLVLGARIHDDLFRILQNVGGRTALRATLLQTYFDAETGAALQAVIAHRSRSAEYALDLWQRDQAEVAEPPAPYEAEDVRSEGFRRAVVRAYANRCAICGIRIITPDGHTVVEAAHIVPWAETHNDDIRNGLALCCLCHWAFDALVVSVDRDRTLLVSPDIIVTPNMPGHIIAFSGRPIVPPAESRFAPLDDYLDHHRQRFRDAG